MKAHNVFGSWQKQEELFLAFLLSLATDAYWIILL